MQPNGNEKVERVGVLIRLDAKKKREFEDMYPWHGTLSQFFVQALDEFLELSRGQKTPSQLTHEAVANVVRRDY